MQPLSGPESAGNQAAFGSSGAWGQPLDQSSIPERAPLYQGSPNETTSGPEAPWASTAQQGGGVGGFGEMPWGPRQQANNMAGGMEVAAPWATGAEQQQVTGESPFAGATDERTEDQQPTSSTGLRQRRFGNFFGFGRGRQAPPPLQEPEESKPLATQAETSADPQQNAEGSATNASATKDELSPKARRLSKSMQAERQSLDERAVRNLLSRSSKRKEMRDRSVEEKEHLRPLLLTVLGFGRKLANCIHFLFWRIVGDVWLDQMYSPPNLQEKPINVKARIWGIPDDGFYRAVASVHKSEPWNRERLHLETDRHLDREESVDLLAEESRETLGCGLCAPRLTSESMDINSGLVSRFRSHAKSNRQQLHATQLYELRLDVSRVTLLRVPHNDDYLGFQSYSSKEGRAAAELQELYRSYRKEADADVSSLLTGRLDVLAEYAEALRRAMEEEQRAQQNSGQPDAQTKSEAKDAFLQHLEERHKMRMRRNEKELQHEALCRQLYTKWRELKVIREAQGFISTPWKLRARPESHDAEVEQRQRAQEMQAELEERVHLKGETVERAQTVISHVWSSKRAPGEATYHFEVFMGEELTTNEQLAMMIRDEKEKGGYEDHWIHLQEELDHRRQAVQARVRLTCFVGERFVGRSPSFPLRWDTWATSPVGSGSSSAPPIPLHSFDLALHTMPRHVTIMVEVSPRSHFCQRWYQVPDIQEVEIPSFEGRRVTHAPVLDQNLTFGPSVVTRDGATDDEYAFSGEVAVRVSWPGIGRNGGFAVPPHNYSMSESKAPTLSSMSPRGHPSPRRGAHTSPRRNSSTPTKADERLTGMRYDPQDPDNARMLLESSAPKALPGYDLSRLPSGTCQLDVATDEVLKHTKRIHRLLQRADRDGFDVDRTVVPAFDKETFDEEVEDNSDIFGPRFQRGSRSYETEEAKDFIRRIRQRVQKVSSVKTHLSYKSIVREHGEDAEEGDLMETLDELASCFAPKRALRPLAPKQRKTEGTAKSIKIHVSFTKVYNAPIRCDVMTTGGEQATPSRSGQWGGAQAGFGQGVPMSPQGGRPGFNFPRSPGGVSMGYVPVPVVEQGPPKKALPEVIIEMSLEDLSGYPMRRRTVRVSCSTDPDINQVLEVPLHAPDSKEDVSQTILQNFAGNLTMVLYDEVAIEHTERGGYISTRIQRRFLGRLVLPWSTIYASKGSLKGLLRVNRPTVILGYRSKQKNDPSMAFGSAFPQSMQQSMQPGFASSGGFGPGGEDLNAQAQAGGFGQAGANVNLQAPPGEAGQFVSMRRIESQLDPESLCLSFDVTVDPALNPPVRVFPSIIKGKEPSIMLKHVHNFLESLKMKKDLKAIALGTDMDGRSRLICRFIRPQPLPSHINPEGTFPIEAAARYVSMIPFLQDVEMFPQLDDLWCTDQEFLDIQCGDWEEHAILLCNYFNYIDRYRRAKVEGYATYNIQSFCLLCDVLPYGEVMIVLRRDMGDDQGRVGHCEFWEAVSGNCYFVPTGHRRSPGILEKLHITNPPAEASPSESCKATAAIPIQRVHVAFNGENVWANLQKPGGFEGNICCPRRKQNKGVLDIDFNFDDRSKWCPLFATEKEQELIHLPADVGKIAGVARSRSGLLSSVRKLGLQTPTAVSSPRSRRNSGFTGVSGDPRFSYQLEDPSQVLRYKPRDDRHAEQVETRLQDQLEQEIFKHRSAGEHSGVQHNTRFDSAIANRFGDILGDLEQLENCRRRTGGESIFPLRSHVSPTISMEAVDKKLQAIENDFKGPAHRGRHIFGVPLNQTYTDFKHLWEAVRDTRILELGDDYAEYAVKVRVFAYDSGVLSVWVFIACALEG